ncbi:MAG: hypothetical protein LBQ65_04750 [Tannerellaceae bacterium]|jgi:hypothetical protein|nr:hypothetical protein [Tannerellaceae bacterium]
MRLEASKILEKAVQSLNEQIKPDKIIVVDTGMVRIKSIDFICGIKGNITNANINTVLQQILEHKKGLDKPMLLVAKYIYPELMNELANHDISILDSAGNCVIRQDNLLLIVKGQKNVLIKETTDRSFQETGIKLIFHFLLHPESVNLPYRTIQEKTNISLGTIKNVMGELIANHFILITNQGRFLKNRKKLLERWGIAYNQTLKPKLLLEQMTFRNNDKRDKWLTMNLPEGMYWGGESGANMIDHYLYPGTFDIYSDVPAKTLLSTGFVMPKEDGEIKIYQKFWLDKPENGIVHALLIYADLMGRGNSRCLEMAQKIYEHEFSDFE